MPKKLKIDLTNEHADRLVAAFATSYQATIDGNPNPETKDKYAMRQIRALLLNHVRNQECALAKVAAVNAVTEIDLVIDEERGNP